MTLTINPTNYDIFVGIDVDQKSYAITYFDHSWQGKSFKMPANPKDLLQYFRNNLPEKRLIFAYEAGPTGYELHDFLISQNQVCIVIHPASLESPANEHVKTNRIDSRKIAEQLKAGKLGSIRVPIGPYRTLRHLTQLREQYAEQLKRAKQRIRSLILLEHIKTPTNTRQQLFTAKFRPVLRNLSLMPVLRFKLDILLDDLDHARKRLLAVIQEMKDFSKQEPAIQQNLKHLQSIPGFGFIVSTYVLSRVGDPVHLRNVRELGAFCGIVPREYSTGDTIRRGSITRSGDRNFRRLLIEAAWVAITKDADLRNFYWRLRTKVNKPHGVRIAIVAVARKLTHRVYCVLKEQREYVLH